MADLIRDNSKPINLIDIGLTEAFINEALTIGQEYHLARVSVQHRDLYGVITENGEMRAEISGKLGYSAYGNQDYPTVGDWVLVDRTDNKNGNGIIHYILTRKSCFERKSAGTGNERQIIAANIDTVFICMALNQDFNLRRVERYLSIAWDSGAVPVVVLTKADICDDLSSYLREMETVALGVDVIVTTSLSGDGYRGILKYITQGKTVAFIGSSGVGKSTLINRLMGEEILQTKKTRADDKGRHTTTHRQMLILPQGGVVIDTPGMREIQIASADLSRSFSDIEQLARMCYFKDCQHESEPRCAVRQAVEDGRLSVERVNSYKKLQKELLYEQRRSTLTAGQAEKLKVIDMMGSLNTQKEVLKNNFKYKKGSGT